MQIEKVNIYSCLNGSKIDKTDLPDVFLSQIRTDILSFVHSNMSKNRRQAYATSKNAGMMTSAKSWGTGRAVARVPRVPGSGTHRSGQGAITNMCRGGRMFGPTTTWRKWHHKINKNQRKHAIRSAIASSGISSLITARGHNLKKIPEIPLVLEGSVESFSKTNQGQKLLKCVGVSDEIKKKNSIRHGKGKMRNRRFSKFKGPIVIYEKNARCFRNIKGIDICCVNSLNLLNLAPGGHIGRLCIWTYLSFSKLDILFNLNENFNKKKILNSNNIITSPNLKKIINSDRVQSLIRPVATPIYFIKKKKTQNR
uniref:Large ribosomal subunit protein uL4 n=1 Tax=Cryptomonas curvata TaxID=233186 RepID=A0A7S0QM74_9CRYP|nr:60S ribosomal protein L1 [Cryptomonas curvata]|mmetsp:Transcript_35617/g.74554  ORF Transcript_35617/g.74554 Transcript_35617/m.74554 type:complete len:311 (+) Transcript_35617:62-994(+)